VQVVRIRGYSSAAAGRWASVVFVLALVAHTTFAGSIQLRDAASTANDDVQLRDIAALDAAADRAYGDLVVATLDDRNRRVVVTRAQVHAALSEQGVHWGKTSLGGFNRCEVTRRAASPTEAPAPGGAEPDEPLILANPDAPITIDAPAPGSPNTLGGLLTQRIRDWAGHPETLRITLASRDRALLDRAASPGEYTVKPLSNARLGRLVFLVERREGGRVVESDRVIFDTARQVRGVVAARRIMRDEPITASDVAMRTMWIDDDELIPVASVDRVVGKVLRHDLKPGSPIVPGVVESPSVVERGQTITVRQVGRGFRISFEAQAGRDAAVGDVIPVRRANSRQRVMARVTGPGQAILQDHVSSKGSS